MITTISARERCPWALLVRNRRPNARFGKCRVCCHCHGVVGVMSGAQANRLRSRRSNLETTPKARRLWLLALITVGHRYHSNRAPQCEQMRASSLNGVAKFSTRRQANEPCDISIPGIAHEFRGDGFAQFRSPALSDLAARDERDFDTSDAGTARAVEPQVFRMWVSTAATCSGLRRPPYAGISGAVGSLTVPTLLAPRKMTGDARAVRS
jgi:hypothetical protein